VTATPPPENAPQKTSEEALGLCPQQPLAPDLERSAKQPEAPTEHPAKHPAKYPAGHPTGYPAAHPTNQAARLAPAVAVPLPSGPPAFFPQAALARHIPWPQEALLAPLNPAPGVLEYRIQSVLHTGLGTGPGAPLPCVRLAYALWYLPPDQGEGLLRLALKAATLVLAVDFKLAERNLELPAVLAARCFTGLAACCRPRPAYSEQEKAATQASATPQNFLRHGGIEGLASRAGAVVLQRRTLLGGAAALLHLAGA